MKARVQSRFNIPIGPTRIIEYIFAILGLKWTVFV